MIKNVNKKKAADKFTRTNLLLNCIQKFSTSLLYTPENSVVMAFGHQSKTLLHVTPKTFILNPASLQHEKDRK